MQAKVTKLQVGSLFGGWFCECKVVPGLGGPYGMAGLQGPVHEKQGKSEGFDSCDRPSNLAQIWSKSSVFSLCDLEIWWMTSKNNRVPLLYYIKLCASFQIHRWIKTGVTVWKRWIRVKICDFLSRVTLKFTGWPWKTIARGTSSILHQALCIISKPWVNSNWSYSPETLNLGQNQQFFVLCDLEIWWMTLKNNRAPLPYYIKLCASFQSHGWIQTGVTARKC